MRWLARHERSAGGGRYEEDARFARDDPAELVLAALSCPVCLRSEWVHWMYEKRGPQPHLDCGCLDCDVRWYLRVTPEQILRIEALDILGYRP
jgi:hypothetical protein